MVTKTPVAGRFQRTAEDKILKKRIYVQIDEKELAIKLNTVDRIS